nr:hypothetical protein [Mucilaginibacter sp. X5P1]
MLRSPSVLMWVIGIKNVNVIKNQTIDYQIININSRGKKIILTLWKRQFFSEL